MIGDVVKLESGAFGIVIINHTFNDGIAEIGDLVTIEDVISQAPSRGVVTEVL